jgi:hypothetical protein
MMLLSYLTVVAGYLCVTVATSNTAYAIGRAVGDGDGDILQTTSLAK